RVPTIALHARACEALGMDVHEIRKNRGAAPIIARVTALLDRSRAAAFVRVAIEDPEAVIARLARFPAREACLVVSAWAEAFFVECAEREALGAARAETIMERVGCGIGGGTYIPTELSLSLLDPAGYR